MPTDSRKIRANGQELGEIPLRRLYTMRMRGELENPVEFYSKARRAWLPIAGFMDDFEISHEQRIQNMRDVGIKYAEILNSGTDEDCPACVALSGKKYPINSVPSLPPPDCSCVPWCRCVIIAVET